MGGGVLFAVHFVASAVVFALRRHLSAMEGLLHPAIVTINDNEYRPLLRVD